MEVLKGVFGMGAKFLLPKNVKTFSCVGRRFNIPKKKNHPKTLPSPPMEIQHSYRKRIFTIIKRLKYPYHPLKPPAADHCPPLLPPSATVCRHLHQGYFWKFINYSGEFNLYIKHS